MHGYRLTRRGKFVLAMLVMIVSLAGTFGLQRFAIASDKSEYVIQNSVSLSKSHSQIIKLHLTEKMEKQKEDALNAKDEFLTINVEDIRSYDKSKVAFLTFDDGPSSITPVILDILDNYDLKATFFVLGNMCEKNSAILDELYNDGHSIGIHSYSHDFHKLYKDEQSFTNEVKSTEDILKKVLGNEFSTRLFRFPGGSFENYKNKYMNSLNELGYVSVDWNAVTGDTEFINPTPEKLLNRLKETTYNKNNVVVLMHDSETKQVTAEVLPDVIEYLQSEGYEFAILK